MFFYHTPLYRNIIVFVTLSDNVAVYVQFFKFLSVVSRLGRANLHTGQVELSQARYGTCNLPTFDNIEESIKHQRPASDNVRKSSKSLKKKNESWWCSINAIYQQFHVRVRDCLYHLVQQTPKCYTHLNNRAPILRCV